MDAAHFRGWIHIHDLNARCADSSRTDGPDDCFAGWNHIHGLNARCADSSQIRDLSARCEFLNEYSVVPGRCLIAAGLYCGSNSSLNYGLNLGSNFGLNSGSNYGLSLNFGLNWKLDFRCVALAAPKPVVDFGAGYRWIETVSVYVRDDSANVIGSRPKHDTTR